MSIIVSAELAAAIEASERTPLVRVAVDWDADGFGPAGSVDDLTDRTGAIKVVRSLTTDLPDPVRLVEGSAAATATIDLTEGDPRDETMHPARYYTRGSDSPLGHRERIGRPVTVDIGFRTAGGPQYVRRLTGRTRNMKTKSQGRAAALTALDNRALLRNTVRLIPTDGTTAGADGTWIVTQALAANGIFAGPAPRDHGQLLWVPMYGSILPIRPDRSASWQAGFFLYPSLVQSRPTFTPGPFVLAATPTAGPFLSIQTTPMSSTWDTYRGRLEMWVLGVPSPSPAPGGSASRSVVQISDLPNPVTFNPTGYVVVGIDVNGHPFMRVLDATRAVTLHLNTGAATVANDGAWHPVGVHWDHRAQTVTFMVDGGFETQATGILTTEVPSKVPIDLLVDSFAPISDLHLHDIPASDPWLYATVAPTAVIDPSLIQLQASYEAAPRESFELLSEVAAAEQATATFDEAGVFRYRTRARLTDTAGQTVQRVLTTADVSLLEVDVDDGIDRVRNIVQVSYSPVTVSPVFTLTAYADTTARTLPPLSTLTIPISFPNPVLDLQTFLFPVGVFTHQSLPVFDPYIVLTTNADGTDDGLAALAYFAGVTAQVLDGWTTGAATLQITNLNAVTLYVTALGVSGLTATVGNTVVAEVTDPGSVARYGPQLLQHSSSQWVQTAGVAQSLARALLGDLKDPHLQLSGLTIVGDPRRQLGDRVTIADPSGTQLSGEYWLTQVEDAVGAGGDYIQTIAARGATTVARYGIGRYGIETYG